MIAPKRTEYRSKTLTLLEGEPVATPRRCGIAARSRSLPTLKPGQQVLLDCRKRCIAWRSSSVAQALESPTRTGQAALWLLKIPTVNAEANRPKNIGTFELSPRLGSMSLRRIS